MICYHGSKGEYFKRRDLICDIFNFSSQVSVHVRAGENEADDPIVDVAIMSSADYFIGNCVSSFSSFVRRQRKAAGKPTAFFGISQ